MNVKINDQHMGITEAIARLVLGWRVIELNPPVELYDHITTYTIMLTHQLVDRDGNPPMGMPARHMQWGDEANCWEHQPGEWDSNLTEAMELVQQLNVPISIFYDDLPENGAWIVRDLGASHDNDITSDIEEIPDAICQHILRRAGIDFVALGY